MPSSSPQEMISFKACTADADAQSPTVQCMCISEDTGCVQPQSAEACTCSMCNCHHPLTTSAEKPSVAHTAPSHDSQATKSRLFQANTNKPELVCSHLSSQHSGCLQANGSQRYALLHHLDRAMQHPPTTVHCPTLAQSQQHVCASHGPPDMPFIFTVGCY